MCSVTCHLLAIVEYFMHFFFGLVLSRTFFKITVIVHLQKLGSLAYSSLCPL